MFDNIISTLNQLYNALTFKIKVAILGAIILLFITLAWFAINSRTPVVDSGTGNAPTVINDARDLINRIGNPWQLGTSSYISNYPFLINDRVDSNIYILDINTSMLYDPYYKGLFDSDSNIKESLESKPENYTDSYQVFYNSTDNRTVNAFSRMLNFSPVEILGQKRWFMEEGETYWLSDRNTDLTGIQEVKRSKELLPAFRKLQRIGAAKFLSTTPDPETMEMVYVTMELNNIPEAYSKVGRLSFNFLNETPAAPIDPLFVGAITAETVLPTVYPLSGTKTLNKSVNTENATITFADITNVQAPTLLSDKQFNIKEYNSIFITCAPYERAKCWIYNPGLKSIVEIDANANKKDIRATLDVDLTKLPTSLKQTFDKDKLLRYNSESDELLFFYDGKWQSVLRLS
jgi:hypothetical protein